MRLPEFRYFVPQSISEACEALADPVNNAVAIAGGTDLLPALKNRLQSPEILVDLSGLPGLDQITFSPDGGLQVGALVTLRRLAGSPVVREKYPLLVEAARSVGAVQIQAMGTVAGNLCQDSRCLYYNQSPQWRQGQERCYKLDGTMCHAVKGSKECRAVYCGDLAPALLALQAEVRIAGSRGEKVIPLGDLYTGDAKRPNALKPGQVVTGIRVPAPDLHSGAAYLKLRRRQTLEFPLLGVAVSLTVDSGGGICRKASLALTGVERRPLLIEAAGGLEGGSLSEKALEDLGGAARRQARPLPNAPGLTPIYRRDMVSVYVRLAVRQAVENALRQGGAAQT